MAGVLYIYVYAHGFPDQKQRGGVLCLTKPRLPIVLVIIVRKLGQKIFPLPRTS